MSSHKPAPKISSRGAKHFWCPHPGKIWAVGEFQSEDEAKKTVKLSVKEDNAVSDFLIDSCILIEDNSVITEDVDDLISLSQVNDATILNCSRIRFHKSLIYTSIGSVLMAVNPFERIEGLYGPANIKKYHWDSRDSSAAPHIYLTPAGAYKAMASFGKNQSLIISGESGAGKTEATKQCLDYLTKVATRSGGSNKKSNAAAVEDEGEEDISEIAHRIIAASPILEAFGNAQTVRNPNSSRFGKWMELSFDKHNAIKGSRIISYLLEKSRVTQHDPKERNYHLFYQLVRGASPELLTSMHLQGSSARYKYLCQGQEQEAKDFKDAHNFTEMMEAFHVMGFDSEATLGTLRLVAAVLLLGNVEFVALDEDEASRVDEDSAESRECFQAAAALLGVEAFTLGMAMSTRTIQSGSMRKSITTVRLNRQKASDTRDSLARCVYDKLFLDVIKKINVSSQAVEAVGGGDKLIGLLDIFGFEIFELNSFEQLCINFCNEMLQNHFTSVIFVAEIKMYEAENIYCDSIEFKDNANIIKLIEDSFKFLDEESKIPRGSSKTWFDKIKNVHNPNSLDKKKAPTKDSGGRSSSDGAVLMTFPPGHDAFTISHYAGPVSYVPTSFMEKNTEILSNDLVTTMLCSEVALVKEMFAPEAPPADETSSSPPGRGGGKKSPVGKATTASLSKNFQTQLQSLMSLLGSTESHFVKCIKSSSKCRPKDFEASLIHRQLLYSGVFEVVKIQQSGLPSRLAHAVFNNRYRCVLPMGERWEDLRRGETSIASALRSRYTDELAMVQVGRTMTFMKGKELRFLENLKVDIEEEACVVLQHWLRLRRLGRLFSSLVGLLAGFEKHVAALQLETAEEDVAELQTAIERFSLLSNSNSLVYLADRSRERVTTLKLQLKIVTSIDAVMASGGATILTDDSFDTLTAAISDAESIMFNHSSVTMAIEATRKFTAAKDAIARIKVLTDRMEEITRKKTTAEKQEAVVKDNDSVDNDEDGEAKAECELTADTHDDDDDDDSDEVIVNDEDQLTSTQLADMLLTLGDYCDTLPGAAEALAVANQKLDEIKVELDLFVPRLMDGLRRERLKVDGVTGEVALEGEAERDNGNSSSPLSVALTEINQKKLRGKECRVLYRGCAAFLVIKSVAMGGDAQATIDRIQDFRCNIQGTLSGPDEPTPDFMQDLDEQFSLLQSWASDKLIFAQLSAALTGERVGLPAEQQQEELLVGVEELRRVVGTSYKQGASLQVAAWLDFCKVVLQMREMYNAKRWADLYTFLSEEYTLKISVMENNAACLASQLDVVSHLKKEQQCCAGIATFYLLCEELKEACKVSSFSLIDVDDMRASTTNVLQASVTAQADVLRRAKQVERTFNSDFHLLVELVDLSTQLRLHVMEGRFQEGKTLAMSMKKHRVLDLVPKYNTELECCLELIDITARETELESCMRRTQVSWRVFRHPREALSSIQICCSDSAAADFSRLEAACNDVQQLNRRPKQLMQRATFARLCLLVVRRLSSEIQREDSFSGCPTMTPCLVGVSTAGRSACHELATPDNLKACIEFLEQSLTSPSALPENLVEINCLLLELQRRLFAYLFHDVVHSHRSVTGRVGHLVVDKEAMSASVQLFANVSGLLNSFRLVVKNSEVAVLPDAESQKLHPADKARPFPTLFLSHLDPVVSLAERVISVREAVRRGDWPEVQTILADIDEHKLALSSQKAAGNKAYFNSVCQHIVSNNEELALVKLENDHNNLISTLREAVDNLQVEIVGKKFNPAPQTIKLSSLEKAKSQAVLIGCHSEESRELLKVADALLTMLQMLKDGKRDEISLIEMTTIHSTMTNTLNLNGVGVAAVLHYVKVSQVIQKFYDTAVNASDSDTKELFLVTRDYTSNRSRSSRSKATAVSEAVRCDLAPWTRRMDLLRQLRLLRCAEDWPAVVELVQSSTAEEEAAGIAKPSDPMQVLFLEYLKSQRNAAYRQAKAFEVAAQFSIASSTGMVGSKGVASFHTPELGISMLRNMIDKTTADSKHYDILPEALQQKEQLASLLLLRESVLRESVVVEVEKTKTKSLSSRSTSIIGNQSPGLLAARDKTSEAVSRSAGCQSFSEECKFVSETSSLLQLVENVERELLKPVVTWERAAVDALYAGSTDKDQSRLRLNFSKQAATFSEGGQVEISTENVSLQKRAIQKLQLSFPDRFHDIALVTVAKSLHDVLTTAEHLSEYGALEDKLRALSILVQVLDIPRHLRACLEAQVEVFQKGHMIDRSTALVMEGVGLLSAHCHNKAVLDEYLDRITHLTITAGETNLPSDVMSCVQCLRCCRELVVASDFLLATDFAKHRKELERVSAQAPEWFSDLLQKWVASLHDPMSSTAEFVKDSQPQSVLMRQESAYADAERSSLLSNTGESAVAVSLCLEHIGSYLQQMAKVKSLSGVESAESIDKQFSDLHTPFSLWKERFNLVNLAWQGFHCLNEALPVSDSHLSQASRVLLTPWMPIFHVDTHALSLVTSLMRESLPKEPIVKFRKAMADIERTFSNIVEVFEGYVQGRAQQQSGRRPGDDTTRRTSGSGSGTSGGTSGSGSSNLGGDSSATCQLAEVELAASYCSSLVQALAAVQSALTTLEELAGLKFSKRVDDPSAAATTHDYLQLSAEVISEHGLVCRIFNSSKKWNVEVETCPRFMQDICVLDSKKKPKLSQTMFAELLHALTTRKKQSSPSFEFWHHSTTTNASYLVKLNTTSSTGKVIISLSNSEPNAQLVVSCSTDVFAACKVSCEPLVNMVCTAADELKKTWKTSADPSLSFTIQDILGPHNPTTGNFELKELIAKAREAVDAHLGTVSFTSSMLQVSQAGYNLLRSSPWQMQWIDGLVAEKHMQLVSAHMPTAAAIGESSHAVLEQMVKSHSFLRSEVELLCGTSRVFQENVMDILAQDHRTSTSTHTTTSSPSALQECLSAVDAPHNSVWKFSRRVAKNSVDRLYPSRGVLHEFVSLVQELVAALAPSVHLQFFSAKCGGHQTPAAEENTLSGDVDLHVRIRNFVTRISSRAMHPLVTFVILCTQELNFISIVLQRTRDPSATSDDSLQALEMLTQGTYFVESFGKNLNSLITCFKDACFVDNEMKTTALDLIATLEQTFEELRCRLEGLWRLKVLRDDFFRAAVNRKNIMMPNSMADKKKKSSSGSFVKSSAVEVVSKTLSMGFKNRTQSSNKNTATAAGNNTFLKPVIPEGWIGQLESEGHTLDTFFRLRALTLRWQGETGGDDDSLREGGRQDDQEKAERQVMAEEAELLLPLSAAVVCVPDVNMRSHLMKEIGVVTLRNSKLDLDDKISEIIMLVKMCGCDIRALQLGIHKRGLFDVPDLQGGSDGSGEEEEDVVLGATRGGAGGNRERKAALQTTSHYLSFLDVLDCVCSLFLGSEESYLHTEGATAPSLSRGELGKRVGMLYMSANNLGSLGRPTDDLHPPKMKTTERRATNSSSTSGNTSAASLPSSSVATSAVTPVHLLATRLMFMGHIKSRLAEIVQKVEGGSMHPLGRSSHPPEGQEEGVDEEKEGGCEDSSAQLDAVPPVPLSAEAFNWLAFDDDTVDVSSAGSELQFRTPSLRRSSSTTRVRNAAKTSPNYSVDGLKGFYLDLKRLFNAFMDVRCEFYQNLGVSNISKCVAFLNALDDFSAKYYINEMDEIMEGYEMVAKQQEAKKRAGAGAGAASTTISEEDGNDCDGGGEGGDVVAGVDSVPNECKDIIDVLADAAEVAPVHVVLSTRTLLGHLCTTKDFNSKLSSPSSSDMSLLSCICLPEWVCERRALLGACRRMRHEAKYALQSSMLAEYHKNLTSTLEKHKGIFDEVVQASFSSRAEPRLLLAAVDSSYCPEPEAGAGGGNGLSSGHHLLHVWFSHRFEEKHVKDGIAMDAIVFEFLKEDVFESEESARSFFEALDKNGNGSLSFREIMDGALSNTYAERYYLEKFISKLRRRNSLRRSVIKGEQQQQEEEEDEEEEVDFFEEDDIQHIHEAFLQFYFKDVMADNLFLDNLVKAVPNLDGDEELPAATTELLQRAKLIMKLRNAAHAGFFFSNDEQYSVEEFLDEWFDSIPDPEHQVGSSEVRAVHVATKNKVVRKLFDTKIKSPLEMRESAEAVSAASASDCPPARDKSLLLMDHDQGTRAYARVMTDSSLTSKDIKSTLNSFFLGKEFACSSSTLVSMREASLLNDFLLTRENDCWEGLAALQDHSARVPTLTSTDASSPSVARFFEDFLHEFRCRDFYKAATEELHSAGEVDLSLLHPPGDLPLGADSGARGDQEEEAGVSDSDEKNSVGSDNNGISVSKDDESTQDVDRDDDDGNDNEEEEKEDNNGDELDSEDPDDEVDHMPSRKDTDDSIQDNSADFLQLTQPGGTRPFSSGKPSPNKVVVSKGIVDNAGGGGITITIKRQPSRRLDVNDDGDTVGSGDNRRTITLPAPGTSCGPLIAAVYNQIVRSASKHNSVVDKRLVLLYQFLDFQALKSNQTDGSPMRFRDVLKVCEWIQLSVSEWSSLFPQSYGVPQGAAELVISQRSLRQPVSFLKTLITIERRRFIQLWQHQMFKAVCRWVRADTSIVIPNATRKDYYDGDEEAKAAAIRMAEFSDFNAVDMGKSTTIRTMELNEVLSANLKKLLTPFAKLYCIFATNQYRSLFAHMSQPEIDRINFIFNSDPADREIQESLRVFNWILAGLPREEEDVDVDLDDEDDVEEDNKKQKQRAHEAKDKEVNGVKPTSESASAPPTPLELLSIALQCSIPAQMRQQLLFCRLQCVNAVNKKFLIKELRRAADGDLKEHLGRQQVFTDLSKAFTELSFILVEMENKDESEWKWKEAELLDDFKDEEGEGADDVVSMSDEDDEEDDDLHSDSEEDGSDADALSRGSKQPAAPSPRSMTLRARTGAGRGSTAKRTSISHAMDEFKNTTSALVKAGHWILRLEMSILTEDWESMDALVAAYNANPIQVKECPDAISSFISLGADIRSHNECLDKMESYLYYNASKSTKVHPIATQGASPSTSSVHQDARPFFHFVNFPALKPLVSAANISMLVKSSELTEKLEICDFLIKVKSAIEAEKWFENEAQNEKFIADMHFTRPPVVDPAEANMSEVARRIQTYDRLAREKKLLQQAIEARRDITCVSTLLKKQRPENLPRIVATEIQRIEREFQNQQVEICLVEALSQGHEYLKNNELSLIQVDDLEEVCDIASGMTQRSQRTSLLFDSAQKVMNLRRCLKAADWVGVRCWLSEPSEVAPEAFSEIDSIEKMSAINLEMHVMLENAMQSNCVGGTYMKLDTNNTNISMLLVAIRNASHCPKLSPEDRQICYTAECLKSIRLSILMSDYDTLIAEISAVDVKDISSCALDEFSLVKKAINFFECMNKLRACLGSNGPKGSVGSVDAQNISIYRLGSAINSIDHSICSQSIQLYLTHASVMKNIRSAFKGGRFGITSLVECLVLECVDRSQRDRSTPPQLEHSVRHVRKMTYGREILGGVYINDSAMNELSIGRPSDDYERGESAMTSLLQVGMMSNTSEQWKKRVYKDGDNITALETPYEDIAGREFYLSTLITSPLLQRKDPDSVAAQLGQLMPQLLSESEAEVLLVRDELYNRIALNVLSRGLIRTGSSNKHDERRFKGMDVDMSPIQIEHAISIVQHLGIKSEAVMKLYHTALVMKKMRFYSRDVQKSKTSLNKVVEALGQVKSLKSNNLFATTATAEIELIFNMVCSKTIRTELTNALDQCLPRLNGTSSCAPASNMQPFSGEDDHSELKKIALLRQALRAASVNGEQRDAESRLLRDWCQVLHAVMAAKNSGIHDRMIQSHDQADKLATTTEITLKAGERMRTLDSMFNSNRKSEDELNEIDLPSLAKRMSKEISNQRRSMMAMRLTSAASSSSATDNPLQLVHTRRGSIDGGRGRTLSQCSGEMETMGPGGADFSAMNSLQLYEATGETKTSTLIEKGKMIAAHTCSSSGAAKSKTTTSFFPPFFHGPAHVRAADHENDTAAVFHDTKVVKMIQAVVKAHAESLKPTPYHMSPQKMKQEKTAMSSVVRVSLQGDFRRHLEAISSSTTGDYSAVQKVAATFLLAFLKYPRDVKVAANQEHTVTLSKRMLESSCKLLTRNEQACFIAGASVAVDKKLDGSSDVTAKAAAARMMHAEKRSELGHVEKRSELRMKSRLSFDMALNIGEFVEISMVQLSTQHSTNLADQKLTARRLTYLEGYLKSSAQTGSSLPGTSARVESTVPFRGQGAGECKDGSSAGTSSRSAAAPGGLHPIYAQVVLKIRACRENAPNFSQR